MRTKEQLIEATKEILAAMKLRAEASWDHAGVDVFKGTSKVGMISPAGTVTRIWDGPKAAFTGPAEARIEATLRGTRAY